MDGELEQILNDARPAKRRRDAHTMLDLMTRVTGQAPVVHGSVIGFGSYDYRYDSGRKGTGPAAGFALRRQALVVYLVDGVSAHAAELAQLGAHKEGVGRISIKDLEQIDVGVLEQVTATSYATLTAGVYTLRAREGRPK
jgi:hypothetical protein